MTGTRDNDTSVAEMRGWRSTGRGEIPMEPIRNRSLMTSHANFKIGHTWWCYAGKPAGQIRCVGGLVER